MGSVMGSDPSPTARHTDSGYQRRDPIPGIGGYLMRQPRGGSERSSRSWPMFGSTCSETLGNKARIGRKKKCKMRLVML